MKKTRLAGPLYATAVIAKGQQQSKLRVEAGELWLVVAVENEETGETGHLSVIQAYDKRDVEEERHSTDNPALFRDHHPKSDWHCGLLGEPDVTPEDAAFDAEPGYGYELDHKDGKDGWGLYAVTYFEPAQAFMPGITPGRKSAPSDLNDGQS